MREADEGEADGHGRIEGPGNQNNQVISDEESQILGSQHHKYYSVLIGTSRVDGPGIVDADSIQSWNGDSRGIRS